MLAGARPEHRRNEVSSLTKKLTRQLESGVRKGFPGTRIQSPRGVCGVRTRRRSENVWFAREAGHVRSVDAVKPRYVAEGSTSGLLRRGGMRCRLTGCRLHGLPTYGLVLVFLCRGDLAWALHTPTKPVTARDAVLCTSRMENAHRAIPLIQGK